MDCSQLADELLNYIRRAVLNHGGSTTAVNPGKRIPFQWPPHPASYGFHLQASDWLEKDFVEIGHERFVFEVATTEAGLFGRIPDLWYEARAGNKEQLKTKLAAGVEPLLDRQRLIAQVLERPNRFTGRLNELSPIEITKLLYCPDRDVANDARREIETHASSGMFFPALLVILEDCSHPYRRSAQWAVLDLFEDLGSFARTEDDVALAVAKIKSLIWDALDDYARTVYKAGVVLGGHMPYWHGAKALVDCLEAPSKIGRRSAIHGLYHLAEWAPEHRATIIEKVERTAELDDDPLLRRYALEMARDIKRADTTHVEDIVFPDEPQAGY